MHDDITLRGKTRSSICRALKMMAQRGKVADTVHPRGCRSARGEPWQQKWLERSDPRAGCLGNIGGHVSGTDFAE